MDTSTTVDRPFRLLSIDGGGTWALIPAKVLIDLCGPQTRGHEVLARFDGVAANSGGSIVVAGLLADWPLQDILNLFLDERSRRRLFEPVAWYRRLHPARWLDLSPRWTTSGKARGLSEILDSVGQRPLRGKWVRSRHGKPLQVTLVAFDYQRERAMFFRAHDSRAASLPGNARHQNPNPSLAEAVHASTTAPIRYFDRPAQIGGRQYWDGAVAGYNNPTLVALVELMAEEGPAAASRARVLSLGTGTTMLPLSADPPPDPVLYKARAQPSIWRDVERLARSILSDPPDAHSFIAHVMMGGSLPGADDPLPMASPVVRMNPLIQGIRDDGGSWQLPVGLTPSEFERLTAMEMDAIGSDEVALIARFCDLWMDDRIPNQPVRASRDTLRCEIGHPRYRAARQDWLSN